MLYSCLQLPTFIVVGRGFSGYAAFRFASSSLLTNGSSQKQLVCLAVKQGCSLLSPAVD